MQLKSMKDRSAKPVVLKGRLWLEMAAAVLKETAFEMVLLLLLLLMLLALLSLLASLEVRVIILGRADKSLACRSVEVLTTRSVLWDFDLAWKLSDCLADRFETVIVVVVAAGVAVEGKAVSGLSFFLDGCPPADLETSALRRLDLNSLKSAWK
jgi:hypothetical protein